MKRVTVLTAAAAGVLLLAGFWLFSRQAGVFAQEGKERAAKGARPDATAEAVKLLARLMDARADKDDKHVVTVSGTGMVRVKPDSARLFFSIESYAEHIGAARADNAARTRKVLKALEDLKIANLKTKSDNINVQQLTDRNDGRSLPRILGYHVVNSFTVLVENEDRLKLGPEAGRVLDTVLENGGTGISQIMFFKKGAQVNELRRQAMTKAVEDALANGRALLAGMNRTKLEPLTVSVTPQYYGGDGTQNNIRVQQALPGGAGEATTSALVAGDLEYRCHVSVTCHY